MKAQNDYAAYCAGKAKYSLPESNPPTPEQSNLFLAAIKTLGGKPSRQDICDYLGMSKWTVMRALNHLRDADLVQMINESVGIQNSFVYVLTRKSEVTLPLRP